MFTWTDPDDETVVVTLPEMSEVPGGALRATRRLGPVDAMFTLVEAVADPAALAVLDALPARKVNEVFAAWAGGVSAGESSGSST